MITTLFLLLKGLRINIHYDHVPVGTASIQESFFEDQRRKKDGLLRFENKVLWNTGSFLCSLDVNDNFYLYNYF
jgi:hypothetical protein